MKYPKALRGARADRFMFLLEAGLDFEAALTVSKDDALFKETQEKYLLKLLRANGDLWIYEQIQTNYSTYGIEFRDAFIRQTAAGESGVDALRYAERRTNTRVSFWKGETAIMPPNIVDCPTNIRVAICSTDRMAINDEHFEKMMTKLGKTVKKIDDVNETPNIVGCFLVPDPGYVRLVCTDRLSISWVTSVLAKVQVWPNASLCVMREKKFLESQIFSLCLPNCHAEQIHSAFKDMKKQNPGLSTENWTILKRQRLQDENNTLQVHLLIPRKGDAEELERAGYELEYKFDTVKFTIPDDGSKTNDRVQFIGEFPCSVDLPFEELLQIIEAENDFICTDLWSNGNRRKNRRKFFTDLRSAEAIKQNSYKINFKSTKVTLTPLRPIMEFRKTKAC